MKTLIDKDALVAEIEKLIKKNELYLDDNVSDAVRFQKTGAYSVLNDLLHFLDTFEVKEVDLEKELEDILKKEKAFVTDNREVKYYNGDSFNHIYELEFIAKHFFELGLKAQKGE